MANSDVAKGLSPVRYLSGAPYNGAKNDYFVPATDTTAIYIGDMVKLAGSADTDGVATVGIASSTNAVVGVVVGVRPVDRSSKIYREASVARYVEVADDPNLVFEIQEVSGGTALTAAAVGLNANFTGASGSTVTGFSTMELDNSTEATTATLDFQLLGLAQRTDNAFGEHAKWEVRLNNHQFVDGTTGVS
jgi:hypothetical protein